MVKLSVCMIAKNEEPFLAECLESISQHVDEVVVVDTGSTDSTKKIAQDHGAHVFDFEWCDDFSLARNESLKHATGDWILIIDADECIADSDMQKIRHLIEEHKNDFMGFTLEQRNYTNDVHHAQWQVSDDYAECKKYKGFFVSPIVRLFKRDKNAYFSYKVHEDVGKSIIENGGKIAQATIPIHHYGFTKGEKSHANKQDFYLKLGLEELKNNPKNVRAYFDVGKIYKNTKRYEEAISFFEKGLALKPDYAKGHSYLAETQSLAGNQEAAEKTYLKAISIDSKEQNSLNNLGVIFLRKKEYQKALGCFDRIVAINPNNARALSNLAKTLIKVNKFYDAEQVFKEGFKRTKIPQFKKDLKEFQKKMDEKLTKLNKDLQANNRDLQTVNKLGELYFRLHKFSEARDILSDAVRNNFEGEDTDSINLMVNLAQCHSALGEFHVALKVLDDAIIKRPEGKAFFEQLKARIKAKMA